MIADIETVCDTCEWNKTSATVNGECEQCIYNPSLSDRYMKAYESRNGE